MQTFLTIRDLAESLEIPIPTLRGWCIEFEKSGHHQVSRNDRDDRVFDEDDIEIFTYMKELKDQYGRKAGTKDLINFIVNQDRFKSKLKPVIGDPFPMEPKSMLTTVDVNEVIANERFMAKLNEFIDTAVEGMEDRIVERANTAFDMAFKQAQKELAISLEQQHSMSKSFELNQLHKIQELIDEQKKTQELLKQQANMSLWQKIFGKKTPN